MARGRRGRLAGSGPAAGLTARLEELRRAALLDRVEADLASASASDAAALVAELQPVIAGDPLAERPRALEMRALDLAGRQAQALAVFAQALGLLADRLGVDPSPQLAEVHVGVLRQTLRDGAAGSEAPAASRRNGRPAQASGGADPDQGQASERPPRAVAGPVPAAGRPRAPLTSFVGREQDVERVRALLASGRLVTLTGPGGSDKTRLATVVAGAASGQDGDPVCVAELAPLSEPGEIPGAVLAALGVRDGGFLGEVGHAGARGAAARSAAATWAGW